MSNGLERMWKEAVDDYCYVGWKSEKTSDVVVGLYVETWTRDLRNKQQGFQRFGRNVRQYRTEFRVHITAADNPPPVKKFPPCARTQQFHLRAHYLLISLASLILFADSYLTFL